MTITKSKGFPLPDLSISLPSLLPISERTLRGARCVCVSRWPVGEGDTVEAGEQHSPLIRGSHSSHSCLENQTGQLFSSRFNFSCKIEVIATNDPSIRKRIYRKGCCSRIKHKNQFSKPADLNLIGCILQKSRRLQTIFVSFPTS